jgi:hypothetical protein
LPDHTGYILSVLEDAIERSVLGNPLDRGFLADFVDTHQVVAGLTDQGGNVWIFVRGYPVALLDRCRGVALELGHSPALGYSTVTRSFTSWNVSRSPETTTHQTPPHFP